MDRQAHRVQKNIQITRNDARAVSPVSCMNQLTAYDSLKTALLVLLQAKINGQATPALGDYPADNLGDPCRSLAQTTCRRPRRHLAILQARTPHRPPTVMAQQQPKVNGSSTKTPRPPSKSTQSSSFSALPGADSDHARSVVQTRFIGDRTDLARGRYRSTQKALGSTQTPSWQTFHVDVYYTYIAATRPHSQRISLFEPDTAILATIADAPIQAPTLCGPTPPNSVARLVRFEGPRVRECSLIALSCRSKTS
jgi:hypothetical protein